MTDRALIAARTLALLGTMIEAEKPSSMGYTDTMLDQARAKLDAGETAAAWELTTAIAKAEPENVRAWALMADIVAPVSPERAARYREKARAAATLCQVTAYHSIRCPGLSRARVEE